MVRVIGVDPGSASWDFVGMEDDGTFFLDHSIPTKQLQKHPELFLNLNLLLPDVVGLKTEYLY